MSFFSPPRIFSALSENSKLFSKVFLSRSRFYVKGCMQIIDKTKGFNN